MTMTQTVDITANRRTVKVPREIPAGRVVVTFAHKQEAQEPKKERKLGCLKGQIWMAEDFDAPLEDFKDYM